MNAFVSVDEQGCQLSWTRRMTIVIGIAKGLKYLHTEIDPPFTISELNSSAVYLTDDFSPKVTLQTFFFFAICPIGDFVVTSSFC